MNDFELFGRQESVYRKINRIENELKNISLIFEDSVSRPIYLDVIVLGTKRDKLENELRIAKLEQIELEKVKVNTETEEIDNHYFMQIMKNDFPLAYEAMKNGIATGIIDFKNNLFNFRCDKGCVGIIFNEAGYTDYKQINRYILINGEIPADSTLRNNTKNTPPKEWEKLKIIFFPNNLKITPE